MRTRAIAIDAGSSSMKAYDGDRSVSFPSIVYPVADPRGHEAAAIGVTVDGRESWSLVGHAPRRVCADPRFTVLNEREYHGSTTQYIQICEALRQLGAAGEYDFLLCSVPYSRYRDDLLVRRLQERLHFAWRDAAGNETSAVFAAVQVTPQGAGALRWWLRSQGEAADALQSLCVVDIGSCTTDIAVVTRGAEGEWEYVSEACASNQRVSTRVFCDAVRDAMAGAFGLLDRPLDYWSVMDPIVDGSLALRHMGERLPMGEVVDAARRAFTADLLQACCDTTRAWWPRVDRVLLTGGGASLLNLSDLPGQTRIVSLDAGANARGQYHYVEAEVSRNESRQAAVL